MKAKLAAAWHFLVGIIRDPHSLDASSARIYGGLLVLTGICIAIYGAVKHQEHAATVATLTTTGTGMIAARAKSAPGA